VAEASHSSRFRWFWLSDRLKSNQSSSPVLTCQLRLTERHSRTKKAFCSDTFLLCCSGCIHQLLFVPLLWHGTGQIIKSLASFCRSVCPCSYGRNFCSILMKFCTEVGGLKSRKASFGVKIRWPLPFPCFSSFSPPNAFFMGRSKYCSNEACGLIVARKSSNDVPRERLQAQSSKML